MKSTTKNIFYSFILLGANQAIAYNTDVIVPVKQASNANIFQQSKHQGISLPDVSPQYGHPCHQANPKPGICDGYNEPRKTQFDSGYKFQPNQSFESKSTRTRSVCTQWDNEFMPHNALPEFNVPHQVVSTEGFLNKETEFVEPNRVSGGRHCIKWGTQNYQTTTGHVSVRLGKDNVLNKPIVLVQGYNLSFDGFKKNVIANERAVFNNFDTNSQLTSSTFKQYYDKGYDIVVFRYHQQDSGIESNAWALTSLLEFLGPKSSQIRLIGHSMGGVVSRLALSYMEQKGQNHKVSHFVSVDAPYRGINVPTDVRVFADELENQAGKIKSCSVLFFWNSRKRRDCRATRHLLRSTNDVFDSYTFKQLDSGSTENKRLQTTLKNLSSYFNNVNSTAVTYGVSSGVDIPGIYTGNRGLDLKLDIKWKYLSGGRHSRLYSTAQSAANGSYISLYKDISREMNASKNILIDIKKVTLDDEANAVPKGNMSFVSLASALDGHGGNFNNVVYANSWTTFNKVPQLDHRYVYFPLSYLGL